MRSLKSRSIWLLVLLGVIFGGANLWLTASRSTIPLGLRGKVRQKQRLIEKTPGVDDVFIVTLDSDRRIQVDGSVFDLLVKDQTVIKARWERTMTIEDRGFPLSWSSDFYGMMWSMPLTVTVITWLGLVSLDRTRQTSDELSS
ncbi:MAG: hypothetical protein AAGG48_25405 [Planctomycetota bacterium]